MFSQNGVVPSSVESSKSLGGDEWTCWSISLAILVLCWSVLVANTTVARTTPDFGFLEASSTAPPELWSAHRHTRTLDSHFKNAHGNHIPEKLLRPISSLGSSFLLYRPRSPLLRTMAASPGAGSWLTGMGHCCSGSWRCGWHHPLNS